MDVYVKETLYVIDYNNDIPDAELRNTIFVSDDHRTAGYAYNIAIKEANTGYSDLTFSMPNTIIDADGRQIKNPKLELLVPLAKVRYRRQVYYTGEEEINVREPESYGDSTNYHDRVYSPLYPNNIIEDYTMDYVIQPVDKKRNVLEIATNFTAMDYPRFTLSKKRVGLLIDNDTITKEEWSIVSSDRPMDRPGMIKYKPWTEDLSRIVLRVTDPEFNGDVAKYEAAVKTMCKWNPMTAMSYPLTKLQVERLKSDQSQWDYGFDATCFYWPIEETGRYKGILYEEGGWIGFQGYDLVGLQIAGLDPELHTTNTAWHWTQIYKMKNYLTPNTALNYLRWILDGTAWEIATREEDGEEKPDVDTRLIQTYNPKDGTPDEEVPYTAYLQLSGSNCYNAITSLCQSFQLYPVFDCLNRKVSLKLASGKNYGLVYRLGDNIKSDTTKADGEKVITKLYVSGGSDNIGSANINIGTAVRECVQHLQGFYNRVEDIAEVKGQWAVIDDSLTDFDTTVYELDYHPKEEIVVEEDVQTMPELSASIVDKAYHYTGITTNDFTRNFTYQCKEDDRLPNTYYWLDVTGEPYLHAKTETTHGLGVPNYWEVGSNREVWFRDNGQWVLGEKDDDYCPNCGYTAHRIESDKCPQCNDDHIHHNSTWRYNDYMVDEVSGLEAPWDPNDVEYIMARSPYWTNYIMNLRWYYQNGWITKEQILELYQNNLQINDLNKAFGDKYIEDRRATQTAYETAKNNYDIAQDGFESTLYAMENKYYKKDGDFSSGYDYCFHVKPKDVIEEDGHYFIRLSHCYNCHITAGLTAEENEWSECPECHSDNIVNNKVEVLLFNDETYTTRVNTWPYGSDTTHIYGEGYVGGYKYNPQLKGYFLRLVVALDKMDARESNRWDVQYYEQNISVVRPIDYVLNESQELVFDQYTYKLNNVYVRSTSGQIEVWNEAVQDYIKYYGQMLDNKLILDEAIKHIEQLEAVYESWNTILQGIYERIQIKFGDFIVEGNYQNTDQPYVPILFNEGLDASDKYSIPEVTYNLDVVDAGGLVEYRYPTDRTKYVCEYCGYESYRQPRFHCVKCGKFPLYRVFEHDTYNDLVRKLHSVGQIIPKAGDYVSIYDEPMGFFGVPGLITEVDRYLDDPIKNTIRLDTSYTNEEQLVGNIITATNTVLSNKDIYARTAYINADGTLDPNSIKDTLNTSGADISIVSTNGSILLNGQGLRCIDPSNPYNAIKYTGTGIYKTTNLNNENGEDKAVIWERMMTPEGINATYINSGTIDTNKINITAGSGAKVIIDKFGLYVKTSTNASAHITDFDSEKAKTDPNYTNYWGNLNNIATFVGVDNNNDPLIYTRGFLVANEGSNIANWITSDKGFYHLSNTTKFVCPTDGCNYSSSVSFDHCPRCGEEVTPIHYNRDLWLSPEGMKGQVYDGTVRNYSLYANGNFGVTPDGILYATSAKIKGTGEFGGKIVVTDNTSTINGGTVAGFDASSTGFKKGTIILSPSGNAISSSVNTKYTCQTNSNHVFYSYADVYDSSTGTLKCPHCQGAIVSSGGSGIRNDWAIYANGNFGVTTNGSLYAYNANIEGKITATSGSIDSLTVNNCTMTNCHISAAQIDSGQIGSTQIADGAISTNKIAANSITAGKLNVSTLSAIAADVGSIRSLQYNETGAYLLSAIYIGNGQITTGGYADYTSTLNYEGLTVGNTTIRRWEVNTSSVNVSNCNASIQVNAPLVKNDGALIVKAGSNSWPSSSASGSLYLVAGNHVNLRAGSDKHVYAGATGWNDGENSRVTTAAGNVSSRSTKENIKLLDKEVYIDALQMLKNMKLYTYDYKYDLYDHPSQYGFILDEIEEEDKKHHFLDITNEQAWTRGRMIDFCMDDKPENDETVKVVDVKNYNRDAFTKYLLTCIKALQQEIEEIKKEKTN